MTITAAQTGAYYERLGLANGEQADGDDGICWRCDYPYEDGDLVEVDGLTMCGPCARIETDDDGLVDTWRDL